MPTVYWEFMGRILDDSIHYRVYDNGTLIIISMLASREGTYTCIAENVVGNATASITVTYEGTFNWGARYFPMFTLLIGKFVHS